MYIDISSLFRNTLSQIFLYIYTSAILQTPPVSFPLIICNYDFIKGIPLYHIFSCAYLLWTLNHYPAK